MPDFQSGLSGVAGGEGFEHPLILPKKRMERSLSKRG